MKPAILLSLIMLSACTGNNIVYEDGQKVFSEDERLEIESVFGSIYTKYEIYVDIAVTNNPGQFPIKEPNNENAVRFYMAPNQKTASMAISEQLQKIFPKTSARNLSHQILDKYMERNEPVKGLIITAKSLVSHLHKKGLLKKREQSQALAYWVFAGLIFILIIFVWINHRSKNQAEVDDVWTDAYRYND